MHPIAGILKALIVDNSISVHEVLKPWYINYTCLAVHARTGEALVNLSWHLPGLYNTTGIIYTIRTLTVPTFHPNRTSKQLGVSSVTTRDPYLDVTLKPHSDYTFTVSILKMYFDNVLLL